MSNRFTYAALCGATAALVSALLARSHEIVGTHSLTTRAIINIFATLSLLFAAVSSADAHAHLNRATPAVGSTTTSPPSEVVLWFSETLEPAFSNIEVRDAEGATVQAGKSHVDANERTKMSVPLKPLQPGTYKVNWRVLSVDTHRSQGNFTFRVGK